MHDSSPADLEKAIRDAVRDLNTVKETLAGQLFANLDVLAHNIQSRCSAADRRYFEGMFDGLVKGPVRRVLGTVKANEISLNTQLNKLKGK